MLSRAAADREALRDLRVGATGGQQGQYLRLPLRQRPVVPRPCAATRAQPAQQTGRRVGVRRRTDALECPERETRLGDRRFGSQLSHGAGQLELRPPGLERQVEGCKAPQRRLEMREGSVIPLGGTHTACCQLGEGGGAPVPRACGEVRELLDRLVGGGEVVSSEPDLHQELQRRCATGIGRDLSVEAEADEILRQRDLAPPQRDRGQRPPGNGMRLVALEQAPRLIEPSLPDAQVPELDQRRPAHRAIAALEGVECGEEFPLRLVPAPDRDEDPPVVGTADRRHEFAPRPEASGNRHPLLGARDVERDLAGAHQPAADVADRDDADHLARRDRGHRLVDQPHALGHTPGGDVGLAEQCEGVVLEIDVAEPPPDLECGRGQPSSLGRVVGERSAVDNEPAVPRTLLRAPEQRLRPTHPTARDRHVAVDGAVQERQPARAVGGLHHPVQLSIRRERALRQLDRARVFALEVEGPAQTVQGLGALAVLERLLERGARAVPVGFSKCLPAPPREVIPRSCSHRGIIAPAASRLRLAALNTICRLRQTRPSPGCASIPLWRSTSSVMSSSPARSNP